MEQFFSLGYLTREQLRELYRDACKVGKLLIEYDRPDREGHYEMPLPEAMILDNIAPGDDNYLVYHLSFEDFPDATTVAFPLRGQLFMTAYIDFDNALPGRFAEKYGLDEWWQMEGDQRKYYPFSEFHRVLSMNGSAVN
jgi:hypothetical protein